MYENSGGGGGSSTLLIVVALIVFCCCVCVGVGVFIYNNEDAKQKFKDMFGWDDDGETGDTGDTGDTTTTTTTTTTAGDSPDGDAAANDGTQETKGEEYKPPGCGPNNPIGSQCNSAKDRHYICKEPWTRPFIKFNSKGTGPRCCAKSDTKFNDCKKGDALEVKKGWPFKGFSDTVIAKFAGKVKGELWAGTCPGPIGSNKQKNVRSIMHHLRNSKGYITSMACYPIESGSGYTQGWAYTLYPSCYDDQAKKSADPARVKIDTWANKCVDIGSNAVVSKTVAWVPGSVDGLGAVYSRS